MVQQTLDAALVNSTCITIAHRLSTIQHANNIFVLRNGAIIEHGACIQLVNTFTHNYAGKHKALIERGGVYAQMVAKQSHTADNID
jgi:ABC-type transport system involved in Fe-S cluster assembly fused permease/ATPase subunit